MGRIVAVVNQKGGVGKTTTTINLAASLASVGQRVLMVDIDPQANASSGFGIGPQNLEDSVYTVLVEGADNPQYAIDLRRETELPTLQLIPAGPDLYAVEIELAAEENRFERLRMGLSTVRDLYDIVFIDCPPSLGVLTLNALTAADSVLIPMQCEYYALEGLSQLTRTLEMVRGNCNPDLEVEGVLLTMFDKRNNLARQVSEDVRRHFGHRVYQSVIPRNVRLSEAPSFGRPIILYDQGSTGCQSYVDLAQEFLTNMKKRQAAA